MPPQRLEVTVEFRAEPLDAERRYFAVLARFGGVGGFVPHGVVDTAALGTPR